MDFHDSLAAARAGVTAASEHKPLLTERFATELAHIRAQNLQRVRRVVEGSHGATITVNGKPCVNFCSNDYLGLASDPRIAEAARKALAATGTGSGAAALVSGYNAEHRALEEELADFVGRPRALLFSSGWAANVGVLRAVLRKGDALIADELNHASLIDGGRLSGAQYLRVAHCKPAAFAKALASATGADARLVVTDSLFSMDGDLAPLAELSTLCQQHAATLMVDDAHGLGVLGAKGRGAPQHFNVTPEIYVATLGKALGVAGAFVAGSETLIEFLVHRARSWVFSTAPPPALAAAARRALRILREEPGHRARLFMNVLRFHNGAKQLGIHLAESGTPIQPLIVGDTQHALMLSQALFDKGYWIAAIRPPTVPAGTSRLRITLSAAHTPDQIDGLLYALNRALKALPAR